ncbi:MAG: hypothetical protein ACJ79J_11160 [Gemmatimonadaceae bacterium]
MTVRILLCAAAAAAAACAAPPPPSAPKPVVIAPPTDTVRIPLNDLSTRTYYKNPGGLYPGGNNLPPPAQDSAARARRNAIKPLDVNGDDSPFGKFVLLSIGMGNTTEEWCSKGSGPPCTSWSFMGRAAADPTVNRNTLVIVNGAADGQDAPAWTTPKSPAYERIKNVRLAPLGLSENQVQIVWLNVADPHPNLSLPFDSADAYAFLADLGAIARALKVRYPYLQLVFLTSRSYGGYATTGWNPEPFAYEEGFSVKWAIESQINEMRGQPINPRVGSLSNVKRMAPVLLWGPYIWADGMTPRSDGLVWQRTDFEDDGQHPSQAGENKVGQMLLDFFKSSLYTRCWFLANQYCL